MTEAPIPGRTLITAKAQKRVLQALAADELGVPVGAPGVSLSDDGGRLAASVMSDAAPTLRTGPLLTLIESTQRRLTGEGARILGAEISQVAVRITDIGKTVRRVK